jgi:hypothetical protein
MIAVAKYPPIPEVIPPRWRAVAMRLFHAISRVLSFYCIWVRGAFRDSFKIANAWSGLWGPPLLYAFVKWGGYKVNLPEDPIAQAVVLGLAGIVATWVAVLVVQLIQEPAQIFLEQTEKNDSLKDKINALEAQLAQKPRLRLSYAADKTQRRNGVISTYIYATNEGRGDVSGVQVKIEEAVLRRNGSEEWEGTSIVSRTNMSWGFLPDGDEQKYSTVQLSPGSEPLDFISGPHSAQEADGSTRQAFVVRVDPRHRGVNPVFWLEGTYKFVMQISALDIISADKLTLFVDWDSQNLVIRSENPNTVLEWSS